MSDKTGGYCPKCDTVWASPGVCNCSTEERFKTVGAMGIWNAAIEAAAKVADKYDSYGAAYEIRTLKK